MEMWDQGLWFYFYTQTFYMDWVLMSGFWYEGSHYKNLCVGLGFYVRTSQLTVGGDVAVLSVDAGSHDGI